jgi:hypothetical protein
MGLGQILGTLGGGAIGFMAGGPVGAMAGAGIGGGIGGSVDAAGASSDATQAARDAANGVTAPQMDPSAFETPGGYWGNAPSQTQTNQGNAFNAAAAEASAAHSDYKAAREVLLAKVQASLAQVPEEYRGNYPSAEEAVSQMEAEGKVPEFNHWQNVQKTADVAQQTVNKTAKTENADQTQFTKDIKASQHAADAQNANAAQARGQQQDLVHTMLADQTGAQQAALASKLGVQDSLLSQQQGQMIGGFQRSDAAVAAGQSGLVTRLQGDLNGGAPSLAQAQLDQTTQRNIAQQNAMAASAGPTDYGAARRAAIMAGAQTQQEAAQSAAILRAQEYAAARGELGTALQQQRAGGVSSFATAADVLKGQRGQTQTGATAQGQMLADKRTGDVNVWGAAGNTLNQTRGTDVQQAGQALTREQEYLNAYQTTQGRAQQGAMGFQTTSADNNLRAQGIKAGLQGGAVQAAQTEAAGQRQTGAALIGAGGAAAAAGISAGGFGGGGEEGGPVVGSVVGGATTDAPLIVPSDRREKRDVEPQSFASALREAPGYAYEYRRPELPGEAPGRHYGPMAQDLEKTPIGASVVVEGQDGIKRVDTGRLALLTHAELAEHQRKLDRIEARLMTIGGR